jgi:Cu/Ag efflux protein CusF
MSGKTKLVAAAGFFGAVALAGAAFGQAGGDQGEQKARGAERARANACGPHGKAHLGGRLVHSDAKVQVPDGFATITVDRGEITAVDPSAKTVTIKRADGETVTGTASDQTKVCRNGEPAQLSDLKVGDRAGIVQVANGDRRGVRGIRAFSPDYQPPRRSDSGAKRPRPAVGAPFAGELDF